MKRKLIPYFLLLSFAPVHANTDNHYPAIEDLVPSGRAPLPWKSSDSSNPERKSLELLDVLKWVEERMPLVEVAKKQAEAAQARADAARGHFDFRLEAKLEKLTEYYNQNVEELSLARRIEGTPLDIYGGWRRGLGTFRPYEGKLQTGANGESRVGMRLPLLRDFLTDDGRTRKVTTEMAAVAGANDALFRIIDLKRQGADRFWDWVLAAERAKTLFRLYQLATERVDQTQRRVKAGGIAEIELTEIQRIIVLRRVQLIDAERQYQRATLDLSLYLRDDQGQPVSAQNFGLPKNTSTKVGQSPNIDLDKDLERVFAKRPDLISLRYQRDIAEKELRLAKMQTLPDLTARLEYAKDSGLPKDGEKELRGSLSFSFPLENRDARGKKNAQERRLEQIEASLKFLHEQVKQEVQDASSAYLANYNRAKNQIDDRNLSEKLAEAERIRFKNGGSSLLILNLREQAAAESDIRAWETLTDFRKSEIRYKAVMAEL